MILRSSCLLVLLLWATASQAATIYSQNFAVTATGENDKANAQKVADTAEQYRRELAMQWLGKELPTLEVRCKITVRTGQIGCGGATTYTVKGESIFGWTMKVQGSMERIVDSVIPHEINHMVLATHFCCHLPRWADEGAATTVEHESERYRQMNSVLRYMDSQWISISDMLTMQEYPTESVKIIMFYGQSYLLADYLLQLEDGRNKYLKLLADHNDGWEAAFKKHYGFENLASVEEALKVWILNHE